MSIDGANGDALMRVNKAFFLGVPRRRWLLFFWEPTWRYRERIRQALRERWARG